MRVGDLLGLTCAGRPIGEDGLSSRRRRKREIVLAPTLAQVLREHPMASRYKADEQLVFPSSTGACSAPAT
jgi:hypothetical protein